MSKLSHQEAFLENAYDSIHKSIQDKQFLEAESHIKLVRGMGYEKEAYEFTVALEKAKNEDEKMQDIKLDTI